MFLGEASSGQEKNVVFADSKIPASIPMEVDSVSTTNVATAKYDVVFDAVAKLLADKSNNSPQNELMQIKKILLDALPKCYLLDGLTANTYANMT